MNYIETNNKWARQRGTTLIELSVVIAVILLLVGVLFIGVQAWRDGANKSACILNLATIQKAARGYSNMNQLDTGAGLTQAMLVKADGTGFFTVAPACPSQGTYTWGTTVPAVGTQYVTCDSTKGGAHAPANTNSW
jgi:prepilin-type N-terminal cleavage/methylation domain-containing protein